MRSNHDDELTYCPIDDDEWVRIVETCYKSCNPAVDETAMARIWRGIEAGLKANTASP